MVIEPTEGELLRVARLRAGLTQAQVASLVGRPQNAVARWEASGRGAPVEVWREAGLIRPHEISTGEEARILRERLGLTQGEAAQLLGWHAGEIRPRCAGDARVSHVQVMRIEHGEADPSGYVLLLRQKVDES